MSIDRTFIQKRNTSFLAACTLWGLAFLLAGLPVASAAEGPPGMDTDDAPATSGWEHWLDNEYYKIYLNMRLRMELADIDGLDSSQAYTLRTRLGIGTKPFHGFSLFVEGENTWTPAPNEYFDGVERPTGQSIIADPKNTELNQAYLKYENAEFYGAKFIGGRQRIKLDDDRFVGNVGWRQNEQTYDSVFLAGSPVPEMTLNYGYIWDVRRIFGNQGPPNRRDWNSQSHIIRGEYNGFEAAKIVVFSYLLDFQNDSPGNSSNSYGFRVTGKKTLSGPWGISYAGSYAYQTDAGKNPVNYSASYVAAEGGVFNTGLGAVAVGYELLGSDDGKARFVTPLATAHKFNGWADAFLNNGGPNGLQDLYLSIAPKLPWGLKGKLVYHHFWSDEGSHSLADEVDAVVAKPINEHLTILSKVAWFNGYSRGPADRYRFWLEATFTY